MRASQGILYSGESRYGKYRVVDTIYNGRPARVLYGDNGSAQSGVARDDDPELLFDYNQRFLEMIMSRRPKKLLVIGGGAFMLPIAAFHRFSGMMIDVVEVDELLVQLSRNYFDLPRSKRLQVHVEDGAVFMTHTSEHYDMILIDAFSGYNVPPHLFEEDILRKYKQHIAPDGVIGVNFISEYKPGRPRLAHQLVASFSEVFAHCALYQADNDYGEGEKQNLILAASQQPIHFDYLQSREMELLV